MPPLFRIRSCVGWGRGRGVIDLGAVRMSPRQVIRQLHIGEPDLVERDGGRGLGPRIKREAGLAVKAVARGRRIAREAMVPAARPKPFHLRCVL